MKTKDANAPRRKINIKDFGGKLILKQPENVTTLVLGKLIGIIDSVSKGIATDGRPFEGLSGSFKFISAIPEMASIRAYLLFLPPIDADRLLPAAREKINTRFAMSVRAQRNGKGFDLEFDDILAPTPHDPLVALELELSESQGHHTEKKLKK